MLWFDDLPGERGPPSAVRQEAGQNRDERRLSRAVGPEQTEELAFLDGEGNTFECREPAIALSDVGHFQERFRHAAVVPRRWSEASACRCQPAQTGHCGLRRVAIVWKRISRKSMVSRRSNSGSPMPQMSLIDSTAPRHPARPETAPKTGNRRDQCGGASGVRQATHAVWPGMIVVT